MLRDQPPSHSLKKLEEDRIRISNSGTHKARLAHNSLPIYNEHLVGRTGNTSSYLLHYSWKTGDLVRPAKTGTFWRADDHKDIIDYFDNLSAIYNPKCWVIDPARYEDDQEMKKLYATREFLKELHLREFPLPDVIVPAMAGNSPKKAPALYKEWKEPQTFAKSETENPAITDYFTTLSKVASAIHTRLVLNNNPTNDIVQHDEHRLVDNHPGQTLCMVHPSSIRTAHSDFDINYNLSVSYSPMIWNMELQESLLSSAEQDMPTSSSSGMSTEFL